MRQFLLIALIISMYKYNLATSSTANKLHILFIGSSYSGPAHSVPQWAIGEELIPGALLAAQEINSRDDILQELEIEVVPIVVPNCSIGTGIVKTVEQILNPTSNILAVVGLFCNRLAEIIVPLASRGDISLIQLSGATALGGGLHYPHHYSTLAGVEYHARAILDLMQALNWTKIGLLNSVSEFDNYYVKAAETFVSEAKKNRSIEILLHAEVDVTVDYVIKKLEMSKIHIVVTFFPPYKSFDLICRAYLQGLTWPNYAWILSDVPLQDLHKTNTSDCNTETLLRAMEYVIVIQQVVQPADPHGNLVSGRSYTSYMEAMTNHTNTFNPFANIVYDSVWGLGLASNNSLRELQNQNKVINPFQQFGLPHSDNLSTIIESHLLETHFAGASGEFVFRKSSTQQLERTVQITQIKNGSFIVVGYLHSSGQSACLNISKLGATLPTVDVLRVYDTLHIAVTIVLILSVSLCFVFVSLVFIVFIMYRNQPEVKATSRYLSLCIFAGSYLILFGALTHTIGSHSVIDAASARNAICVITTSASSIGLDLILATTLAKALRIAYVFTHFKTIGKAWSDQALLVLIALIVTGKVAVLILWFSLDPYYIADQDAYISEKQHFSVTQYCYSEQVGVWLSLVFAYTGVLCVFLVVLAYRTRRIKRENFKDTKKLNALIAGIIMTSVLFTAMWGVLRLSGYSQISKFIPSVGYMLVPLLCQVLLFIPKLIPPLKRHIKTLDTFGKTKYSHVKT